MSLLSGLVSPRTWLAFVHHVTGLVLGVVSFVVVVAGLTVGFSLLPLALVGLPVLGLITRFATGLAWFERRRLALLTGRTIPGWPSGYRRYRALIVPSWALLGARVTWGELGYAMLRLPVSVASFTVTVAIYLGFAILLASWGALSPWSG